MPTLRTLKQLPALAVAAASAAIPLPLARPAAAVATDAPAVVVGAILAPVRGVAALA